jgi:hypothetical protein
MTPHWVYTFLNSICAGGHFLCGSTMTSTCHGILQLFTNHLLITNQCDTKHRVSLARIMLLWEDLLVDSKIFEGTEVRILADAPNVWTISGILDFLSTYIILHLESLIWEERYRRVAPEPELVALYKAAQKAADRILAWLDGEIRVQKVDRATRKTRVYEGGVKAIQEEYMAQQCIALSWAIQHPEKNGCEPHINYKSFRQFLQDDFHKRHPYVLDAMEKYDSGVCDFPEGQPTFCWKSRFHKDGKIMFAISKKDGGASVPEDKGGGEFLRRLEVQTCMRRWNDKVDKNKKTTTSFNGQQAINIFLH